MTSAARFLFWLPVALVVSCAGGSDDGESASEPGFKPLSQRINEENGFEVDSDGNWVPRKNKRSSFESQGESAYFNKDYGRKDYEAGQYKKKSWWGNKEYDRRSFQGDTDGSRFQKNARVEGERAREAGTASRMQGDYGTDSYATGSAREARASSIAKPSDTETDIRRRVYGQPDVVDWREQRSLSVEQSKGILGR